MVKRISVDIRDDNYKELASLSAFYKQDVKSVIISILDVIGKQGRRILDLSKKYKVPVKLETVMFHMFGELLHTHGLFGGILEQLEVEGLYVLDDFDFDLDERYFMFYYAGLAGSDLQIDTFDVTLEAGVITLTTRSYIEVSKVDNKTLEKLKTTIQSTEVPEEFYELEDYNIEIDEEEEFSTLRINCFAESLNYLPSVRIISEFIQHLFGKAGIKYR